MFFSPWILFVGGILALFGWIALGFISSGLFIRHEVIDPPSRYQNSGNWPCWAYLLVALGPISLGLLLFILLARLIAEVVVGTVRWIQAYEDSTYETVRFFRRAREILGYPRRMVKEFAHWSFTGCGANKK